VTHHLLGPHLAQLCTRALLPAGPHARVAGEELSISDPSPSPKRPPQQDDKDASSAMSAGATEPGLVQRHLALGDVHLCRRAQLCGPRPSLPLACRGRSPSPKRPPQQNGKDAGGGWGARRAPATCKGKRGARAAKLRAPAQVHVTERQMRLYEATSLQADMALLTTDEQARAAPTRKPCRSSSCSLSCSLL